MNIVSKENKYLEGEMVIDRKNSYSSDELNSLYKTTLANLRQFKNDVPFTVNYVNFIDIEIEDQGNKLVLKYGIRFGEKIETRRPTPDPRWEFFDSETNYIINQYALLGDKGEVPFTRRSMAIKDDYIYSGLVDVQDIFTEIKSFKEYIRITKLDLDLNEVWNVKIESEESWFFEPTGLAVNDRGDVIAYGRLDQYETQPKSYYYPFMYLINPEGDLVSTITIEEADIEIQLYPNPVSSEISITSDYGNSLDIKIYDISGQVVKSYFHHKRQGSYDIGTLTPGLYYWVARDNQKILKTGKLEKL